MPMMLSVTFKQQQDCLNSPVTLHSVHVSSSLEAPLAPEDGPLQPGVEALYPGVDPGHPRPPAPDTKADNAHL